MDKRNGEVSRQVTHWSSFFLAVLTWAVILLLLTSCASPVPGDLTDNEKLWKSQNLSNYDFTLERQCFCPEDWRGPVDIQVRNGKAVSMTYPSTGVTATEEKFGNVNTIDKLFDVLRDAYAGSGTFEQKADTVNVTYHAQMGYPLTIYIDVSATIADEEQGYTVEDLRAR